MTSPFSPDAEGAEAHAQGEESLSEDWGAGHRGLGTVGSQKRISVCSTMTHYRPC